jgi:hypothetical protein
VAWQKSVRIGVCQSAAVVIVLVGNKCYGHPTFLVDLGDPQVGTGEGGAELGGALPYYASSPVCAL